MQPQKIVVIGGSAAGAKAASKARRTDQEAEITIIQGEKDLSMASCGFPYYVGGSFGQRDSLWATPTGVVRDSQFFYKAKRINAVTETVAESIDRQKCVVECRNLISGEPCSYPYDRLIICTGGRSSFPEIPGSKLSGVTTFLTMADTDYLRHVRDRNAAQEAVIVGGGLIGVEAAEALVVSGMKVTLIEQEESILGFLDKQLGQLCANHLTANKVQVITATTVSSFLGEAGKLAAVRLSDERIIPCELAIVAAGVKPRSELAASAGLAIGRLGGIDVNRSMQTSDPAIYAAGDCVEIPHLLTGKPVLAPMGDLANLEGRIAGENAAGGNASPFGGTINSVICKLFDFSAGCAGLSEKAARAAGFTDIETVIHASPDKPGFMGAKLLISKMVVDKKCGRLLGFQCIGSGDVSRQMVTAAMALQNGMFLDQLLNLDLPYAPPYSLAIDHFVCCAHLMENRLKGCWKGISAEEVQNKVLTGTPPFLLDARAPEEYEAMRLGIGEKLIPLGALREKINDLPEDKGAEIVCYCKISLRGYETALILQSCGYTNVKVMEGGIMAWPYARER